MPDLEDNLEQLRPPDDGPEIVIGLVGAVGAGKDKTANYLNNSLSEYSYETPQIDLSDLIDKLADGIDDLDGISADEKTDLLQKGGNKIRQDLDQNDALALLACNRIRDYREDEEEETWDQVSRTAYILNSLKKPEEIKSLRNIYGDGLIVIAVYAPEDTRRDRLRDEITRATHTLSEREIEQQIDNIIKMDRGELKERELKTEKEYRQNVRDAFAKADFFLDATDTDKLEKDVERAVNLLFGDQFETPNQDEQCLYIANGARYRSAALGRQVGAALAKPEGEVVSIGCNEVPRAKGGLYWSDSDYDFRDFQVGENIADEKQRGTFREVLKGLHQEEGLDLEELDITKNSIDEVNDEELDELMEKLKDTRLSNLIEFFRSTHAEMEAILSAARKGISVERGTLYSTTFPCHECTRHIITAGIERVVYIEPYPKSLGPELHGDSISVDGRLPDREVWDNEDAKEPPNVEFEPFVGVGHRIYNKVFRGGKRKNEDGTIAERPFETNENRDPILSVTHSGWYIDETLAVRQIKRKLDWDYQNIEGIGEKRLKRLLEAGFKSPVDVRSASKEELTEIEGFGEGLVSYIKQEIDASFEDS